VHIKQVHGGMNVQVGKSKEVKRLSTRINPCIQTLHLQGV